MQLIARRNQISSSKNYWRFILILFPVLFLVGCVSMSDPETSQVQQNMVIFTLPADGSQSAGQTFSSRRSGLESFTITLEVKGAKEAGLSYELNNYPATGQPIYANHLFVHSGTISLSFPPISNAGNFIIRLTAQGAAIDIKGEEDDFYPAGKVIINDKPGKGDLIFSTSYVYGPQEMLSDLVNGFSWAWLVIPLGLVFILPGAVILALTWKNHPVDFGVWLAMSAGLSLAVLALLMLWTGTANIHWSAISVKIAFVVAACVSTFLFCQQKPWRARPLNWVNISFGVIFSLGLMLRFVMIRDMSGPAWVDGVHHALITRLVLEKGSFPQSFAPFFDINPTDYHPGFHSGLASFIWLSGLDIPFAMLIYGQVLNALAIPAAYLFTKTLVRSHSAALAAALFTAFCTPMPAYYTSWARYTQLAGLVVLPVVLAAVQEFLKDSAVENNQAALKKVFPKGIVAWIAAGGLLLVHYRVMIFAAALLAVYYIFQVWPERKNTTQRINSLGLGTIIVAGAAILAMPWLIPLVKTTILPLYGDTQVQPWFYDFSWRYLNTALGQPILALAGMGLVFGLVFRRRFLLTIIIWVGILIILANPGPLGLPLAISNNVTMEIMLFLPINALAGYAINLVEETSSVFGWKWLRPALLLAGVVTILAGFQQLMPLLNEGTMLIRKSDIPALIWAQKNLPPTAVVAINPFLWGYGAYAGADGGYWLEPISGLRTIPPPVASYTTRDYVLAMSSLSKDIIDQGSHPEKLADVLRSAGISYVYSGVRGGSISPVALANSRDFQEVYHQDSVWIFYVLP